VTYTDEQIKRAAVALCTEVYQLPSCGEADLQDIHIHHARSILEAAGEPQRAKPVAWAVKYPDGFTRPYLEKESAQNGCPSTGQVIPLCADPPPSDRERRLREALHHISLCSQNSMSSKEECGRIAREALGVTNDHL